MSSASKSRILARCEPADFVGRAEEIGRLLKCANSDGGSNGIALLAVPSAGTSELLRQAYDRSFVKEQGPIPFYFEIKASDDSLWFGTSSHVVRYDPAAGTAAWVQLPDESTGRQFPAGLAIAIGPRAAWTSDPSKFGLLRIEEAP